VLVKPSKKEEQSKEPTKIESTQPSQTQVQPTQEKEQPQPKQPEQKPEPQFKEYVIQRGDTLAKISGQFNKPAKEIQDANPGVDWGKLKVGQKIKIPQ
jgi:LysM repeat protein